MNGKSPLLPKPMNGISPSSEIQYSNCDAGKILLYLEDMGGLHVSLPDQNQWTRIRYRHDRTQVDGNPILWEVLNAC